MSALSTLAGIIQGEANNPADQFGVASVIYNRAQINHLGYGSDPLSQATAPGQFSAYPGAMQTPSANATALAGALLNGTLPSMGNTGNALYYNAPGFNSAYMAGSGNSYGPGTNQYSDLFNQPPSAGFQLPQLNPTNAPSNAPSNGESDALSGAGQFDNHSLIGTGGSPSLGPLGISPPDFSGLGGGTPSDGSGNSVQAATPDNQGPETIGGPNAPGPVSGDITNLPVAGVNAPISAGQINTTPPSSKEKSQSQGQPLQITGDLPNAITQAGNASAKASGQLGQDVQQSAGLLAGAGTSWLGSIFVNMQDLFVRGGFLLLALTLILGAFVFFYAEQRQPQTVAVRA